MASKAFREGFILWETCRGRNGADIPARVPDDQACEAINVYFFRDGLGRRRNGSTLIDTRFAPPFSGIDAFGYLQPVTPTGPIPPTLVAVTRDTPPQLIGFNPDFIGTNYVINDPVEAPAVESVFVQFNNKLFWAYNSPVNRLHVIDGTIVRRTGLASLATPPTAADTAAAGTYPNTPRWYRLRWQSRGGGSGPPAIPLLIYQSNSSDPVAWVPAGNKQGVVITRPTPPGESENYWQLEGSAESIDGPFYDIGAPIPVATATYTDTQDPATYDENDAAPEAGSNTPWPSVKFLISTGTRLLGFGAWEGTDTGGTGAMTPVMGRVYYSPVVGTTDSADEERISNTTTVQGFVDIARPNGQEDRGLAGPLNDAILVFQSFGVWQLYPTENAIAPYRRVQLDPTIGAVNQQSTVMGHDQNGNPCCYFLDPQRGPYRYGTNGFEFLGGDVSDLWATFNRDALVRSAHAVYYKEIGHILFWIASGTDAEPSMVLVFNIKYGVPVGPKEVRGGWTVFTGAIGASRCSIMRGFKGSPLMGVGGTQQGIVRVDDPGAVVDWNGTPFTRRMTSKAWGTTPIPQNKALRGGSWIEAEGTPGQSINLAFIANYGTETKPVTQPTSASTHERAATRVLRRYDDAVLNDWYVFQALLTDEPGLKATEVDFFFTTFETAEERGNQ